MKIKKQHSDSRRHAKNDRQLLTVIWNVLCVQREEGCGLERIVDQNSIFSVHTPNNSHFSPDKVVNLTHRTPKPDALSQFSIFFC